MNETYRIIDPTYKWGTCGKDLSWSASQYRHIVRKGGLDTLCGNSASHAEIWRDDKRKPVCIVCVNQAQTVGTLGETR